MLTQKMIEQLLLNQSSVQEGHLVSVLLHSLNELNERLSNLEVLLEKRQQVEVHQFKEVKKAMLTKVAAQLNHLEKSHSATITDLTAEVKAVKQTLESTRSKFIGFY